MDLFSEALALADDTLPTEQAARELVATAGGSVERLLDAEHRARALERALPADARAHRLHEVVREAAQLALKTPCEERSSALSDRLADSTGSPAPHTVDVDQLSSDLDRLRATIATG